jgi:hypothetical protein
MAQQIEGTHQHATSGKVYAWRARYATHDGDIDWQANVEAEGEARAQPRGTIHTGSPAADAIAEKAVVDAVLKSIDELEDGGPAV